MQAQNSTFDIAIVGAGVAGAALAAYLGKQGIKVALIEKDWREQDRIVGELLQPGGVQQIKALGLESTLQGIDAQEVNGYALFNYKQHITVAYPEDESNATFTGRGFRNGKFLQQLRAAAQAQPSVACIEAEALQLITQANDEETDLEVQNHKVVGIAVKNKNSESAYSIFAELTVVCDGIFSVFRSELADVQKDITGFFLGLILENCVLPFPNHGHVFTGIESPFLAYPISSNEVRMLIDFPGAAAPRKGAELQNYLLSNVLNQLPECMHPSFRQAVANGKFKVMPNHYMPAKPKPAAGAVLIGDALNMRHPLTGGGMTVALTDVQLLGNQLVQYFNRKVKSAFLLHQAVNEFYAFRHRQDATVNILANALYKVFTHPQLSAACFNYLKQGGKKSGQPVALLSAISRNRSLLLRHFFAVAIDGATSNVYAKPNAAGIKESYKMLSDAVRIVAPLLDNEHPGKAEQIALWIGKKVF